MKTIKLSFILFLWICAFPVFSQTEKIAHKSHSGTTATFSLQEDGGYGLPSELHRLDSVKKYLDTCVVEFFSVIWSRSRNSITIDTLCDNNQYRYLNLGSQRVIDSLKQYPYFKNVKFIGFSENESSPKTKKNTFPFSFHNPNGGGNLPMLVTFICLLVAVLFIAQYKSKRIATLT
jgi:hypothetical protein